MKKVVILIISIIMIISYSTAYCENSLEKYENLLSGTWKSVAYCGVNKDSHHIIYLESFTYPGTSQSTLINGSTVSVTAILTGDDTGEVYLYVTHDLLSSMTVGRVYLSRDGNTMLLKSDDGASFIFKKSN